MDHYVSHVVMILADGLIQVWVSCLCDLCIACSTLLGVPRVPYYFLILVMFVFLFE